MDHYFICGLIDDDKLSIDYSTLVQVAVCCREETFTDSQSEGHRLGDGTCEVQLLLWARFHCSSRQIFLGNQANFAQQCMFWSEQGPGISFGEFSNWSYLRPASAKELPHYLTSKKSWTRQSLFRYPCRAHWGHYLSHTLFWTSIRNSQQSVKTHGHSMKPHKSVRRINQQLVRRFSCQLYIPKTDGNKADRGRWYRLVSRESCVGSVVVTGLAWAKYFCVNFLTLFCPSMTQGRKMWAHETEIGIKRNRK